MGLTIISKIPAGNECGGFKYQYARNDITRVNKKIKVQK